MKYKIISIGIIIYGTTQCFIDFYQGKVYFQNFSLLDFGIILILRWSSVIIHECSHAIATIICGGTIEKMVCYPWRGYVKGEIKDQYFPLMSLSGPLGTIIWFLIASEYFGHYEVWINFIMFLGTSYSLLPLFESSDGYHIFFQKDDEWVVLFSKAFIVYFLPYAAYWYYASELCFFP